MTRKPRIHLILISLSILLTTLLAGVLARPASSQTATQTPVITTATTGATTTVIATNSPAAATATSTVSVATRTPIVATPTRTPIVTTPTAAVPVTANQTPRTITVSGSGRVEGAPDQAVISLGVRTEDEVAATALSQNNTQMQALLAALREEGVAQADIRTLTIQLFPRYQPPPANDPGGSPVVTGFIATNMVQVTVRDLDNLGSLLDAAVAAGGNQIEGISFEISDQADLLDQAREAAMQDARRKADQLAGLAGARLGVVVTIVESSAAPPPFLREMAAQAADSSVPVSPGTQFIQVDIQVTWELQ